MAKKGQRKVNGVWVDPVEATLSARPPAPTAIRRKTQTPADRRNLANRMAGWPVKGK